VSTPTIDEVISIVSSFFTIKGINQNVNILQIEIEETDITDRFRNLVQKMERWNLIARLDRKFGKIFITIARFEPTKSRKAWIPRALFAGTIVTVMIDGYYRAISTNLILKSVYLLNLAILYTVSLMVILGIH